MQAYMKNHFEFFGIKSPDRKEVFKAFIQEFKLPDDQEFENVIKTLWNHPMREAQYCAQELVDRKKWFKRESSIDLIEWMITNKSWWDSVDFIAAHLCGSYFRLFPQRIDEIIDRWNRSDHMWLVRSSILFQLKYKDKTNLDLQTALMTPHLYSKEFFIQKAIGWMLREISKTNPDYTRRFIQTYDLKPVSLREAKKYI